MTKDERSARQRLAEIVKSVKASYGYRRDDALTEIARRFNKAGPDRLAALRIAAERLYSEGERLGRKDGLRTGYSVRRNGQVFSLELLDQTFPEARNSVKREILHGRAAVARGEWDRYLLGVAEDRARERGIDPDVCELVIRTFIDQEEAIALYRDWNAEAA